MPEPASFIDPSPDVQYHQSRTDVALRTVRAERERQDRLKAQGRFEYTCADDGLTLTDKLAVLVEEVGEVAREVLTNEGRRLVRDTEGTDAALYQELCQVAAVSVAWMESLLVDEPVATPYQLPPGC